MELPCLCYRDFATCLFPASVGMSDRGNEPAFGDALDDAATAACDVNEQHKLLHPLVHSCKPRHNLMLDKKNMFEKLNPQQRLPAIVRDVAV